MIENAAMTRSIGDWVKIITELSKIRISQLVAISTGLGYIMATGSIAGGIVLPVLGTFLLSCASAALNQYQERGTDMLMPRTRSRPLPSGKITPGEGLTIVWLLAVIGSLVLLGGGGFVALLLGLFNIALYNGMYTPLKKLTPFAVFPGSLIGAVPPVIGWVSGGGSLLDPQIHAVGLFFFIWQIPHYWLLLMVIGDEYAEAGFPTLVSRIGSEALSRLTYIWVMATILSCLLIPLFNPDAQSLIFTGLIIASLWLLWGSRILLEPEMTRQMLRVAFRGINVYMLLVILLLSLDSLVNFNFL